MTTTTTTTPPTDNLAQITVFRKTSANGSSDGALLSKRIYLDSAGQLKTDSAPCGMSTGSASTVPAVTATMLAQLINQLEPSQALALGSIINHPADIPVQVVTAAQFAALSPEQRARTIARTLEHMQFRKAPTWALFDHDQKDMPLQIIGALENFGGVWSALLNIAPGLAQAMRVTRTSTSSGLSRQDTGEQFPNSGGLHIFSPVKDGSDIKRMLKTLHDRAWLHGLGWFGIGSVGQLIDRSIIDAAVGSPERLIFEGAPEIIAPLVQDVSQRACVAVEGIAIDSPVVIPYLTRDEIHQVTLLKTAARQALEPQAQIIRAEADRRLVQDMVARTGMPTVSAMRQVAARHRQILCPDVVLVTDDRGVITVRDILANPEAYVDTTLCDPMEGPNYGFGKSKVLRSTREPGRVFIHSFAHGGGTYDLKGDFSTSAERIKAAPVAELSRTLGEVVDASELEPDEVQQLIVLCAERAPKGLGVPMFTRLLKDDQKRRAKVRQQRAAQKRREAGLELREQRIVPPRDGALTSVVFDVDQVLAADTGDYPPMRRPDGTLVELRTRVPFNLHQLAANGANADPDADKNTIPAPPEPMLFELTRATTGLLIERYFTWAKQDSEGIYLYDAALPMPYVDTLMQLSGTQSQLPCVVGINTAPMVAASGVLIDGTGLDRDSGLLHYISPQLRACLPSWPITKEDVREAILWLCDEWLCDVLTDIKGKLTIISWALTLIERFLLSTRPAYLITAGQRGGGKTTLVNMVIHAVFGRPAAAAAWSESREERRKALFSYFRQGVAAIAWDNIENGAEIACPEIERSLTSPTITDRILKVSRISEVSTSAIQCFVGNNIKFAGDMASRGPEIRLTTDNPYPENRRVRHADPIGWTQANRALILRALYTILIYGCCNRPAEQIAKTRFRQWWSLAGWPVELAGLLLQQPVALDFIELFKATEAQDNRAAGVSNIIQWLLENFGHVSQGARITKENEFLGRQLREVFDAADRARPLLRVDLTGQVAIDRANTLIELISALMGKRQLSPSSDTIGRVLTSIVDRPVYLNDTIIGALRYRMTRGERWYHVELRSASESVGKIEPTKKFELGGGPPVHHDNVTVVKSPIEPTLNANNDESGGLVVHHLARTFTEDRFFSGRPNTADGTDGAQKSLLEVEYPSNCPGAAPSNNNASLKPSPPQKTAESKPNGQALANEDALPSNNADSSSTEVVDEVVGS